MKLIAEKSDDQYTVAIPDIGLLSLQQLPNCEYQWSGYTKGKAEFASYNVDQRGIMTPLE